LISGVGKGKEGRRTVMTVNVEGKVGSSSAVIDVILAYADARSRLRKFSKYRDHDAEELTSFVVVLLRM
jgi:hypothetical protein